MGGGRRPVSARCVVRRSPTSMDGRWATVVCVHDRKMKEPWCLVASESKVGTRTLIRYYGTTLGD